LLVFALSLSLSLYQSISLSLSYICVLLLFTAPKLWVRLWTHHTLNNINTQIKKPKEDNTIQPPFLCFSHLSDRLRWWRFNKWCLDDPWNVANSIRLKQVMKNKEKKDWTNAAWSRARQKLEHELVLERQCRCHTNLPKTLLQEKIFFK